MRFRLPIFAAAFSLLTLCHETQAADPKVDTRLLELTLGQQKLQGRQVVSNLDTCWLLERDGRLQCVDLRYVTSYKKVSNIYRPFSANEMRTRLFEEFGKNYEFDARSHHYLIAPAGKARPCADLVEKTSKSFTSYFSRRNLKLDKPEAPMVTIVFANHKKFLEYCDLDNVKETKGLRGYYSPTKNRVALYLDQSTAAASEADTAWDSGPVSLAWISKPAAAAPSLRLTPYGAPPDGTDFQATLIHETTHQLGFNSGVHSRLGDEPTWVVEGLAMLFEGDSNRDDTRHQTTVSQRMNRERYLWFLEYQKARRKPKSLEEFLTTNTLFQTQTLDAYSEAWALMFFLAETRGSQLPGYLRKLATRTELGEYTPMKRLADFKDSFGKEIDRLEVQYLRFMKELESAPQATTVTVNDPLLGP